jgi:hypothetical protein
MQHGAHYEKRCKNKRKIISNVEIEIRQEQAMQVAYLSVKLKA